MPLELAARAIYRRVYEDKHRKAGLACSPEHLNGIAYALAALQPLYVVEETVRPIGKEDVLKGLFRDGGRRMIFLDGRAPIERLSVSAAKLDDVVRALLAQEQ
jgi:hypothetical protein